MEEKSKPKSLKGKVIKSSILIFVIIYAVATSIGIYIFIKDYLKLKNEVVSKKEQVYDLNREINHLKREVDKAQSYLNLSLDEQERINNEISRLEEKRDKIYEDEHYGRVTP